MRRGERGDRREVGAATLLVMAMGGLLLMLSAALVAVTALVVAHRSAQSAADLAALAGAEALARGGSGCQTAGDVAGANHAVLTRCVVAGRDISVRVRVGGPTWSGREIGLQGEAMAGPVP